MCKDKHFLQFTMKVIIVHALFYVFVVKMEFTSNQEVSPKHLVPYFLNGVRCPSHQHGASCAVDALIELFYQCIFKFGFGIPFHNRGALVSKLLEVCKFRDAKNITCAMRDNVWDWLEGNLGNAYRNRGGGTDEILPGVQSVINQFPGVFSSRFDCQLLCKKCNTSVTGSVSSDLPSVPSHDDL